MFRALPKGAALALLTAFLASSGNSGQAADDFKPEEGFVSLFNGKDLSGWRYPGANGKELEGQAETADKRIEVKDGVIFVHEKDKDGKDPIKDLYTAKIFDKPFILRLQFRAGLKADSGVYIRGPQLQVRDYPRFGGEYSKVPGFKLDDWNDLEIIVGLPGPRTTVNGKALEPTDVLELTVKDAKPTAKLNGKDIVVTNLQHQPSVCSALCKNNGEILEKAFAVPAKGGIGLQAEKGKFEFRHVRIKEMP
jgi:Domain of Unknown Function (DUF1080)